MEKYNTEILDGIIDIIYSNIPKKERWVQFFKDRRSPLKKTASKSFYTMEDRIKKEFQMSGMQIFSKNERRLMSIDIYDCLNNIEKSISNKNKLLESIDNILLQSVEKKDCNINMLIDALIESQFKKTKNVPPSKNVS